MSAERISDKDLTVRFGDILTADDYSFRMEAQASIFKNFGHEVRAHELDHKAQGANEFKPKEIVITGENPDGSTILYDIKSAGWITNPRETNGPC